MTAMTIELRSAWQVQKAVRGQRVPARKVIASGKDKARRSERREFRQSRKDW